MPLGYNYHTGIRRSQKNKNVFIRSGDGVQIALSGWLPGGYPSSTDGYDFLIWYFWNDSNDSYKNTILNRPDNSRYFICEY